MLKKSRTYVLPIAGILGVHGASAGQLEEVVVTSQKRAESLQDVPVAIQALSGETLEAAGISDTFDLQIVTPGLVVNNTGPAPQLFIRGIGNRLALAGLDPSVALYVDDQYIGVAQAAQFEFADVERIEVLKGPQGTLYGRNASAGAIRIVSQEVDDELSGKVSSTLANYGAWKVSGTVSVPVSDTFGVRLSGLVSKRDGFADNISTEPGVLDELDDGDYYALRAKARWDITDAVTAKLTLGTSEQDDTNGYDNVVLGPPQYSLGLALGGQTGTKADEVASDTSDTTKAQSASAALRFDVAGDYVDFASITTYWDYELNAKPGLDSVNLELDGTSAHALGFVGFPQDADSFSQEFQFVSSLGENLNWIAGLFYYEQSQSWEGLVDRSDASAAVGGPAFLSQGAQVADTTAYAAFGQLTYHLNDDWSVTVGGRYNYEEKEVEVSQSNYFPVTTAPSYEDDIDWTEFTPKLTLEYAFDAGMVYATYSRGFKSGGYNYTASLINPLTGEPEPPVDPEILDMYELGWKTELLDGRLRLNGSLYYYDYQDLQVTANVTSDSGAQANITRNAADAEILGLDMDFTLLLGERTTLTGAMNIMDSEYKDYNASAQVFNGVLDGTNQPGMRAVGYDASGESLLRAPDESAYLTWTYEVPVPSGRAPLSITYAYTGSYFFDFAVVPETSALEQDSYSLVNARWAYYTEDEKWSVALWGKNLLDEDNYFDDINANPAGIRGSHGTPRTYGIDVSYEF